MSTGDKVTLVGAILAFLGILVANRTQWRLADRVATEKQTDKTTAEQEEVTAEQIKAEDAKEERFSRNIWQLIDELQAERATQQQRLAALEEQMSDLRADLEQVRHVEREQRAKVERLKAENAALRTQVERLKAENEVLHRRLADLELKQHGEAPTGPGPAGAPPAIA